MILRRLNVELEQQLVLGFANEKKLPFEWTN